MVMQGAQWAGTAMLRAQCGTQWAECRVWGRNGQGVGCGDTTGGHGDAEGRVWGCNGQGARMQWAGCEDAMGRVQGCNGQGARMQWAGCEDALGMRGCNGQARQCRATTQSDGISKAND